MPPSRRRPHPSAGQAPPVRRPRVAGLRNRPAAPETESEHTESEHTESATEPGYTAPDYTAPDYTEPSTPEPASETDLDDSDLETELDSELDSDEDQLDADVEDTSPATTAVIDEAPSPSRRPAGKRRTAGVTRPGDLSAAEAETKAESTPARAPRAERDPRRRAATQLTVAVVLTVIAVVLAGLAIWFRGEATGLESVDHNTALTDSAGTSEVVGQLKTAIEQTFSYNYTDLAATQKAVDETLTDKARCEYDQLFGQVKEQAPKQKIVMVTAVRDIALVRLDGDRAVALVFIDQSSTRVDVNNSVAGEAQFAVHAQREGEHWKITEFNMFDQPLVNGKPAPKC